MNPSANIGFRRGPALDAALALGLLLLLKATALLVMPIVAALLLALLLSSATEALQRRGAPAALAAALAVFVPAGAVAGLAALAAPAAAGWWNDVRTALARLAEALQAGAASSGVVARGLHWLLAQDVAGAGAATLTRDAGPYALGLASVLMLSFFLLWAQRSLLAGVLRAVPERRGRVRLLGALRAARRGAGSYLATMGWINLGLAVLTGIGLAALGISHVPAWIAVVCVLLFVPYLGPAAIALLLATAGRGASLTAVAAPPLLFLLLHAIEAQFVSPWLMGRRLRVGRPALLVAVMAGGWAWGVVGGVLAVPLLIAAQALLARRHGGVLGKALLAGESSRTQSLADISAGVLENRARGPALVRPWVRRMPPSTETASACASPTSPKPIPPKSTASR